MLNGCVKFQGFPIFSTKYHQHDDLPTYAMRDLGLRNVYDVPKHVTRVAPTISSFASESLRGLPPQSTALMLDEVLPPVQGTSQVTPPQGCPIILTSPKTKAGSLGA